MIFVPCPVLRGTCNSKVAVIILLVLGWGLGFFVCFVFVCFVFGFCCCWFLKMIFPPIFKKQKTTLSKYNIINL